MSAAMSKWNNYKVAFLNLLNVFADLLNNPNCLVTDQRIGFSFGNAAVPPQIRATDTCSNDTNDSLVFTIDFWLGSLLDLNLSWSDKYCGFHKNFSLNWVSRVMLSCFGQKYFQLRLDRGDQKTDSHFCPNCSSAACRPHSSQNQRHRCFHASELCEPI